jgi:cellulose synthase/poly-beta-1,6-N-acetylglucosamine synthase-like glycosyltransferase
MFLRRFCAGSWYPNVEERGFFTTSNRPMQSLMFRIKFVITVIICMILMSEKVPELISQRRRWLNGSFFAAIHSVVKFGYIYRSSHTFTRKFWIHIELFYQTYNLLFSWFALGNFYIAFIILSLSMETLLHQMHIPNIIMQYVYLGLLIMCFLLALGNRPQG